MDINGVIRVNMTGAEIEEALMKARDLPTNTELTQILNEMQTAIGERLDRIIEKTYDEMVALRDAAELVPGQLYRITDYVTTTMVEHTQSAGHPFDIVVLALAPDTLSEAAMAMVHEGDEYFANINLSAWQLKYTLDNIEHSSILGQYFVSGQYRFQLFTGPVIVEGKSYYIYACNDYPTNIVVTEGMPTAGSYFAEIDQTQWPNIVITNPRAGLIDSMSQNGTGTITYLKDHRHNEAFFDFYNIQFKRWKVTDELVRPSINNKYLGVLGHLPHYLTIVDETDYQWFFAFGSESNESDVVTNLKVSDNVVLHTDSTTNHPHNCTILGSMKNCTMNSVEDTIIAGTLQDTVVGVAVLSSSLYGTVTNSSFEVIFDADIRGRLALCSFKSLNQTSFVGQWTTSTFGPLSYVEFHGNGSSCSFPTMNNSRCLGTLMSVNVTASAYGEISYVTFQGDIENETIQVGDNMTVAKNSNGVVKIWNPADLAQ